MEWKKFGILRSESWETGFLFLNCLSLSLSRSISHTHIWAVQDGLVIWRLGGKGLEAKMGSLNMFFRWEATSDGVWPFLFAFELLQVLQHV